MYNTTVSVKVFDLEDCKLTDVEDFLKNHLICDLAIIYRRLWIFYKLTTS